MNNILEKAIELHKKGMLLDAEIIYKNIISERQKSNSDAFHLLGCIYIENRKYKEAIDNILKALKIKEHQNYYLNLGNAYRLNSNFDLSIEAYKKCLTFDYKNSEALYNLSVTFYNKELFQDAKKYILKSINFNKINPEAYNLLGKIAEQLNDSEDSFNYYINALRIDNNNINALINIGNFYEKNLDFMRAIACYERVLKIDKHNIKALYNTAVVLNKKGNYKESINNLLIAEKLDPTDNKIKAYIATNYKEIGSYEDAYSYYNKIKNIQNDEVLIIGEKLDTQMHLCEWTNFENYKSIINEEIKKGNSPISGFSYMSISDDETLQLQLAKNLSKNFATENFKFENFRKKEKYKIGYLSSDIRSHPIGYLMIDVFKYHNKEEYELILIYNNNIEDELNKEASNYFDQIINIRNISDNDALILLREIGIDVLIDLNGLTKGNRINLVSKRIAPIQINYLGYAGTLGNSSYDYILADQNALPLSSQPFYVEKIMHLNFFMANPFRRKFENKIISCHIYGINNSDFIFASLNNNNKITPNRLNAWIRILKSTNNSKLIIIIKNDEAQKNLIKIFELNDLNHRIIYIKNLSYSDYMSLFNIVDLFLDTEFINAGTTAADAIYMDTLILTLKGNSYASRYCSAILEACKLNDLIEHNIESYINKAILLADNKKYFEKLKNKLKENKSNSLLFNPIKFAKNLEEVVKRCIVLQFEGN